MARFLFCLLAWLALPAVADPRVSVTLLAEAQVAGPTIHLGEIARLRSPDLALMRQLVALEVGRAPRAGETASIQARHLESWIARQTGVLANEVEWSGAQESRVERHGRHVSGEQIARVAQAEVQAALQRAGLGHEVALTSLPRDLHVPPGSVRLQPRTWDGARLGARTLVWVDVWVADALVRSVPVSVSTPGFPRSPSVQPATWQEGRRRSPASTIDPVSSELAVERGETAALRTVAGAVRLESRVQVLEDGRVGDVVRVRQRSGTAPLSARVTGPGQVEAAQ